MTELVLIALAWGLYGGVHSLLAAPACKNWLVRRLPAWSHAYRLFFNASALLLLLPPLALTLNATGDPIWHCPAWLSWPLTLMALAGFFWSLRWYDSREFMGTNQWRRRDHSIHDAGPLVISPLHRWVRHPWYSLGLVLLWSRDMNAAWLTSSAIITLYLLIGYRLEEQKLLDMYGETYRDYQRRVPALLPNPWKHL